MIKKPLKQYGFIFAVSLTAELVFTSIGDERGALSVVMGASLALLTQFWSMAVARAILLKKSVAIALFVIVFKYAIFGIILSFFGSGFKLDPLGFFIGFLSLFPSLYFMSRVEFQFHQRQEKV